MKFDVPEVRECLMKNGEVYTVRSFESRDRFTVVPVNNLPDCLKEKLFKIKSYKDLTQYTHLSGFKSPLEWWRKIEEMKATEGWLYRVSVLEEESFDSPLISTKHIGFIEKLSPGQVFVFGSNLQGFHGAGSAGYAMRGTTRNDWRSDTAFCNIVHNKLADRRGKWAVYGIGQGFQTGYEGSSYAIATVERPGVQGIVTPNHLKSQFIKFCGFAKSHPELEFLVVKLGANRSEGGYSWLGLDTVKSALQDVDTIAGVPSNVILPESLEFRVKNGMPDSPPSILTFTGNRNIRAKEVQAALQAVHEKYPNTTWRTGMAYGLDMAVAEFAVANGIPFEAHLPFPAYIQTDRWNAANQERHLQLLAEAVKVFTHSQEFSEDADWLRNVKMIVGADLVVTFNRNEEANTVKFIGHCEESKIPVLDGYSLSFLPGAAQS